MSFRSTLEHSGEDLASLTDYIDHCYNTIVMGKPNRTSTPSTSSQAKRPRDNDSPGAISSPGNDSSDVLISIDKKLSSLDARLSLLEVLHKEFQAIRQSLEFSQQQVETLTAENAGLRESVKSLTEGMTRLSEENKKIKERVIDLQARSMRDNLVFSGIPEQTGEDAELTVKNFIQTHLKLPEETVRNISFHRVHRLGGKRPGDNRPRPIGAKFVSFKQKEQVKSQGRQLKGTNFGVNDQFPKEILDRRRVLFPIREKSIAEGSRAVIAVDKLFINGQLYRDPNITPWLY